MTSVRHVHHCKICGTAVEMYLDHTEPGWTAEAGCDLSCRGTFQHPRGRNCLLAGKILGHSSVRLEVLGSKS